MHLSCKPCELLEALLFVLVFTGVLLAFTSRNFVQRDIGKASTAIPVDGFSHAASNEFAPIRPALIVHVQNPELGFLAR